MVDMGVPAYLVASSVVGILAQRLVRVICSKCKTPHELTQAEMDAAGITPEMAASATFMKGRGCNNCGGSGYRGRLGVFELMLMNGAIRELAFQGAATQDIRKEAIKQGMSTLYDDAIHKVCTGITSLEEVYRVTKKN